MAIVYPTVGGTPQPSTVLDEGAGTLDHVNLAISAGDDDVVRNTRVLTGTNAVSINPGNAQRYNVTGGNVAFVQLVGIGSATNTSGHVIQASDTLDTTITASVKLDFTDHSNITHIVISCSATTVSVWGEN